LYMFSKITLNLSGKRLLFSFLFHALVTNEYFYKRFISYRKSVLENTNTV